MHIFMKKLQKSYLREETPIWGKRSSGSLILPLGLEGLRLSISKISDNVITICTHIYDIRGQHDLYIWEIKSSRFSPLREEVTGNFIYKMRRHHWPSDQQPSERMSSRNPKNRTLLSKVKGPQDIYFCWKKASKFVSLKWVTIRIL